MKDLVLRARSANWSPGLQKIVVDLVAEVERLSDENHLLRAREDRHISILREAVADLEFADRPSEAGRIDALIKEMESK